MTIKELQAMAKEQGLTLTKFKEEGMTKPLYYLESEKYGKDLYSFRQVKFLIVRKVFADKGE